MDFTLVEDWLAEAFPVGEKPPAISLLARRRHTRWWGLALFSRQAGDWKVIGKGEGTGSGLPMLEAQEAVPYVGVPMLEAVRGPRFVLSDSGLQTRFRPRLLGASVSPPASG